MPAHTQQIMIEQPSPLNPATEVDLLLAAQARGPLDQQLLSRLVSLLLELDRFDAVIALLRNDVAELDFDLCMALTKACFYIRKPDATKTALALRAAKTALSISTDDVMRARALCDRGKALITLGHTDEGAADLRESFLLDRNSVMPLKRYAMHLLHARQFAELDSITAALIAEGVVHANVLSAHMLALAGLGQADAARELAGFDRFAFSEAIEVPSGWPDLASFNAQLSKEILGNPGIRYERFGTASQRTWRVDTPALGDRPAVQALLEVIATRATHQIATLPQTGHPWLTARPPALELRCWCVITEAEGFERWHFHPEGWMSGGYYVEIPEAVAEGSNVAGCFTFGVLPRDIGVDAAAQFGTAHVRPFPGMLNLFPSHAQHATHPHGADGQRICLAFDLCPAAPEV